MSDLRTITRQTLVWLAASMVPLQPLCVAAPCWAAPCCRGVGTPGDGSPCHAGKMMPPSGTHCPEGCTCRDATPALEEPMARVARRKSESEWQDDPLLTAALGTVRPGVWPGYARASGPVHGMSASQHCVVLCRLLL